MPLVKCRNSAANRPSLGKGVGGSRRLSGNRRLLLSHGGGAVEAEGQSLKEVAASSKVVVKRGLDKGKLL